MVSFILPLLLVQGLITVTTSAPIESERGIISLTPDVDPAPDAPISPPEEDLSLDKQAETTCKSFNLTHAAEFLDRYGYTENDEWMSVNETELEAALSKAFVLFQMNQEVPATGLFDNVTRHEMCIPRCDVPDIINSKTATRFRRYVVSKDTWAMSDMPLTVGFGGHSSKMKRADQEKAFMAAANSWAQVSGLSFKAGPSRGSKITIDFGRYDGPWGVLAKAWFPKDGRIVFENNENWEARVPRNGASQDGLAFYSVAMHELGHALGISHSNSKNAIMHAQYQRDVVNLQRDDINAAIKLYGTPNRGGGKKSGFGNVGKNSVKNTRNRKSGRKSSQRRRRF